MRMKYESELTARAEEFEDMKRKLSIQLQETEEAYNGAMAKVSNLEKVRIRMASEIDALAADLDNVSFALKFTMESTSNESLPNHSNLNFQCQIQSRTRFNAPINANFYH